MKSKFDVHYIGKMSEEMSNEENRCLQGIVCELSLRLVES